MQLGGLSGRFFLISEWISRFAYVNFLWILFTLLGGVVIGFMPATVSLFAVTRKWVKGELDVPVFTTFWKTYRQEFFKSNLLGLMLFVLGYILYVDLAFLPTEGILFIVLRFAVIVVTFLFFIVLLYIFPVYVHYNWKNRTYIKYALILGASFPHYTFGMIIGMFILYFLISLLPGIIPFFSVSLLAYFVMWVSFQMFTKTEVLLVNNSEVESV
ncbi:YesL family protein [Bacillus sp. AK128]